MIEAVITGIILLAFCFLVLPMAMADATGAVKRRISSTREKLRMVGKSGVTFYPGTFIIQYGSSYATTADRGLVNDYHDVANAIFAGVMLAEGLDAGEEYILGDGTKGIPVATGGMILERVAVTNLSARTDVGKEVYMADNQTLSDTAGSNFTTAVGRVLEFDGTTFTVEIYSMVRAAE